MGNEVEALADEVNEKAGWLVHHWAGGVEGINDYLRPGAIAGNSSSYTRAVHNLVHPERAEDIRYEYIGRGDTNNASHIGDWTFPQDLVVYGDLAKISTNSVYGEVKKKGLAGLFGAKERREIGQTETRSKIPLNRLVCIQDNSNARYLEMFIRSKIKDSAGRLGSFPTLIVVGNAQTTGKVLDFLISNPGQQYDFMREVLPRDKFPNVNSGIFDKAEKAEKLVLVSGENLRKYISPLGSISTVSERRVADRIMQIGEVYEKHLGAENGK